MLHEAEKQVAAEPAKEHDEKHEKKPVVDVEHVKKIYYIGEEKVRALNDVNLKLYKGEVCVIVGASGSGKSTLLNQMAGLEKPSKGTVRIKGKDIVKMTERQLATFRQRNLGFVFQSYNLLPTMTAVENVALPLMFQGIPKATREKMALKQLKALGLGKRANHKPTEMSGGQQQRVGIARAFVAHPAVIFADEPTGNLDSITTLRVMNAVLRLAKENEITLIIVTHNPDLATCADRLITLKDGKILHDVVQENPVREYPVPVPEKPTSTAKSTEKGNGISAEKAIEKTIEKTAAPAQPSAAKPNTQAAKKGE